MDQGECVRKLCMLSQLQASKFIPVTSSQTEGSTDITVGRAVDIGQNDTNKPPIFCNNAYLLKQNLYEIKQTKG